MLCLSVLSAAFASCSKNEFKLEFDLDSSVSGNYRIVYYASDKRTGFMMETIAPVEKGKCETRCITRNPTLVYVFMSGSQMPSALIYAERGDKIRISGKDRNPALWSIGGNGLNEEWSRWRNDNARAIMSGDAAVINAAVAAYVKAHPDSELSALMMLTDFDRRADENRFAALWNSLGENARTEKTAGLAGRGDRPDAAKASLAQKAGRIRLHAIGDSLVELDPGMFAATLMYFMRNEDASVAVDMDTLRSLSRLDEEGKNGRISVISFETDSLAWLSRIRADSNMLNALHAWMPFGEASETAMGLGVTRTPFFIVADRKGRQVYRGDDGKRASVEFRRLMRKAGTASEKPGD